MMMGGNAQVPKSKNAIRADFFQVGCICHMSQLLGGRLFSSMGKGSHGRAISCHIRATSSGIKWISMVRFGVRFGRIVRRSFRFTRDYADLRSGFSFAGVAQW